MIQTDVRLQDKRSLVSICLQFTDYRIGNNTLEQQNDVSLVPGDLYYDIHLYKTDGATNGLLWNSAASISLTDKIPNITYHELVTMPKKISENL